MISASTANMADVEHVYIWYFSLSLVCLWWWWWLHSICEYCMCCAVFGWHNAWLALFSCSSLSDWLSVCGGSASIVLCTKLTNERNEPTKAVDVVQIKMLCCEEEEACYVVMLCYAMRTGCVERIMCEWVCVRAGVWVCVRACGCVGVCVKHTLNSHEPKRKHATRSILSL